MNTELLNIVKRAKKQDESAYYELFQRFKDRIFHTCLGILGNSSLAKDATQEAFIKMFHKINKLSKPEKFYFRHKPGIKGTIKILLYRAPRE